MFEERNPSFNEADKNYENACRAIAIMNLKKIAGGNSSSNSQISRFALADRDLLREQLEIYSPDVIVCCGKNFIFPLASEVFDDAKRSCANLIIEMDSPIAGKSYRYRKIWIDYVHPSIRNYNRKDKFESLMGLMPKRSYYSVHKIAQLL